MPSEIKVASNAPDNDAAALWMRQYRSQKRLCEEANGTLRSLLKRAKSDGMNTKAMIAAVAATKLDPDIVLADLRDQIRYSVILHIPLTQAELFEGWDDTRSPTSDREDDLWAAEAEGYKAGRAGAKFSDCPYDAATLEADAWEKGWHEGQAAIALQLGAHLKPADPSRSRPIRAHAEPAQPALGIVPPKAAKARGKAKVVRRRANGSQNTATH